MLNDIVVLVKDEGGRIEHIKCLLHTFSGICSYGYLGEGVYVL